MPNLKPKSDLTLEQKAEFLDKLCEAFNTIDTKVGEPVDVLFKVMDKVKPLINDYIDVVDGSVN